MRLKMKYSFQKLNFVNKNLNFNNVSVKPRNININKRDISLHRNLNIRQHMIWDGEPFLIKNNKSNEFLDISSNDSYSTNYETIIQLAKERFNEKILIAGPICTEDRAIELIKSGVDIVRIDQINKKFSFNNEDTNPVDFECPYNPTHYIQETVDHKSPCDPSDKEELMKSKCCFHGSSKILMSDGSHKPIDKLQKGDAIINKDGDVVNVNSLKFNGYKDCYVLYNNHFDTETIVTPDHCYYVYDFIEKNFKWRELKDIINNYYYRLVMPKKINWGLENEYEIKLNNEKKYKSKYVLGYYTGLYLLFNYQKNRMIVPGNNYFYEQSLFVLEYILKYIFRVDVEINKYDNYCELILKDNCIYNFIDQNIYLCKDQEFIKGIHDIFKNTSKEHLHLRNLFDLYRYCCINLGIDVNGKKLETINNYILLENIDVSTETIKENVWNLNCNTDSFICNYTVVHNDNELEKTINNPKNQDTIKSFDEDFIYPELSMVINCADIVHSQNRHTLMTVNSDNAFKALVAGIDFLEFNNKDELQKFKNKIIDKMYKVNAINLEELYKNTEFILLNNN